MEFQRYLKGTVLALAVAAGSMAVTVQAEQSTTKTTTSRVVETTYLPGSKEVKQIQQWLLLHSDPTGRMAGDPQNLGTVTVKYTEVIPTNATLADMNAPLPPVQLPISGQPGATFSVGSCGGGVSQSWTYMWVSNSAGGGWAVTDYHSYRTKSCAGNPPPGA
ncbi:hypothetical protein ISN35_14200 [Xanthomonas translucens pv. undulosa]|uniref:hypothetical protein n=1 Tax=Xanthomonas campestris pv. translucens TaxID=343 RepID=UPI001111E98E|nr:hypothetical protein [Xanthomonas translucens]QEO26307.1 hypothetical protein F0H32_08975 [Xanthomonas translucens pv. undulosa]QSQ40604.1 hypothetical protein ISN33_13235 [Xanthomonas translucens pv. translucens]QSQ48200.1 hypothetical protein ISN35_14200 [Xanthomonas translucens pv. undulosa]QSQ53902.1 hypothetical protein ISN36_06725 [Xanthomonas translucens pv. undulosa]QSQ60477.1 hypothetical protein ISN38_01510 [Xanthomonas translucens pv. undulosa]